MSPQPLEINVALQVQKSAHEVFEAIVDPAQMTNYFISQSTGRLEEGAVLTWRFPEFPLEFPVRVGTVKKDEYISWYWEGADGKELLVEITLVPYHDGSTVVRITEGSMENNEAGIAWLKGNTEGWANFLACLKAWVEHGINLRKGSWDFRFETAKS